MFGMLRVVYDGHVYRGIGGEPAGDGDQLEWSGHLTLIAAATPALDTHTSFEGASANGGSRSDSRNPTLLEPSHEPATSSRAENYRSTARKLQRARLNSSARRERGSQPSYPANSLSNL
jgi:hypothetical protein